VRGNGTSRADSSPRCRPGQKTPEHGEKGDGAERRDLEELEISKSSDPPGKQIRRKGRETVGVVNRDRGKRMLKLEKR
jgi:hypothetical protein